MNNNLKYNFRKTLKKSWTLFSLCFVFVSLLDSFSSQIRKGTVIFHIENKALKIRDQDHELPIQELKYQFECSDYEGNDSFRIGRNCDRYEL